MNRGGTSGSPARNMPGAASRQSRQNDEPTSSNVSGSARKRRTAESSLQYRRDNEPNSSNAADFLKRIRNEDGSATSASANVQGMFKNMGLTPQTPQSNPVPVRKTSATFRVDTLLEKRNLALSSINSAHSSPRGAVSIQPASSSTQSSGNGKKIQLMSSDNFMRAIGLFRPDPPTGPSVPQTQRPSSSSANVSHSSTRRRSLRTEIRCRAPPSSLVSDNDEGSTKASTAIGNEAERTSGSGNRNDNGKERNPTRVSETRRQESGSTQQARASNNSVRRPVSIADAATQTIPVHITSIEEYEAEQAKAHSRDNHIINSGVGNVGNSEQDGSIPPSSNVGQINDQDRVNEDEEVASDGEVVNNAIEADATLLPAPIIDNGQGIVEDPEQDGSMQSISNCGQTNGQDFGHAVNNEGDNEDETVGELDNVEAFQAVATPPPADIVNNGFAIVEEPVRTDSVQSSSNVGLVNCQDSRKDANIERVNEDEEIASDGELDNDPMEAHKAVATPPTAPIDGDGQGIVEDPEENTFIRNVEQLGYQGHGDNWNNELEQHCRRNGSEESATIRRSQIDNGFGIVENRRNEIPDHEPAVEEPNNADPMEAIEVVVTPPQQVIVGNGQGIVENLEENAFIRNVDQLGDQGHEDNWNNELEQHRHCNGNEEAAAIQRPQIDNEFGVVENRHNGIPNHEPAVGEPNNDELMEEDQEENIDVDDVIADDILLFPEHQIEDIRQAEIPNRRDVPQIPVIVHQTPPRQTSPEIITIYDDIDGIFEVTLDSDGEEVEERILPNSARVQTDFADDEVIRNVPAQIDAPRDERIYHPAPEIEAPIVQQAAQHPEPEVQTQLEAEIVPEPKQVQNPVFEAHRQAPTDSESPGLPVTVGEPNQSNLPETEDDRDEEEPVRDEDEQGRYEELDREGEPAPESRQGEQRHETYRSFINEDGDEEIELIEDNELLRPPMIGSYRPKQWSYTRVYYPPRDTSNEPSTSSSQPGCSHWYQSGSQPGTSSQSSSSSGPTTSSRRQKSSHRPSQTGTSSQPSSSSRPSTSSRTQKNSHKPSQAATSSRVTRSSLPSTSTVPSTSSSQPGCSHWYQPGTSSQPSSSSTFKTPSTPSYTKKTSQKNSRSEKFTCITRSSVPSSTRNNRNNTDQEDTASINLANVIGLEEQGHSEFLRRRITRSQMTRSTDNNQGSISSSSKTTSEKNVSTTKVENRRTLALQHKLDSSAPHLHQLLEQDRNCAVFDIERFRSGRLGYLKLSVEQRKEAFKAGMLQIVQHSDQKLFFEERVRLDRLQKSEPTLSKKWFGPSNPKDTAQKRSKLMVSRCLAALKLGFDFMEDYDVADYHRLQNNYPEKLFKNYNPDALYTAPQVRNRITNDITFAREPRNRVPVYSDIEGETPESINIPDSLCFDYVNENIVDEKTEILLGEAITESWEEGNNILCVCDPGDPITNCFNNPNCPCFIMNKKLQELQGVSTDPAEFHSFKPLVFNNLQPPFHTHVGFACSDHCGCQGKCTNNPLLLMKSGVFPMEIYRENAEVGFGIRSTGYIPAGLPVLDFVGEIVDSTRLHPSVLDYCHQLTDIESDAALYALLSKIQDWTPNFKKKLTELKEREFHIDCKWQGNISRTLNHSCVPNLECLRIYRKSVTPADMKMVLYTLKNISPGEQLTVDYGDEYWKMVDMKCQCKALACRMGKLAKKFAKFDFKTMAMCFNVFRVDQANAVGANEAFQNQQFKRKDVPDQRREMIVADDEEEDDDEENAGMEDDEQEDAVVDDGQEEDDGEDDGDDAAEDTVEEDEDVNE